MVRAVFFDLDDTLCGYWDACKVGLLRTFTLHPVAGMSPAETLSVWARVFRDFSSGLKSSGWYARYLISGEPTRTEQMRLTLEAIPGADPAMASLWSSTYARERDAALRLFPESIEVLEALSAQYPLGLMTNGPADIQRQEIATLGIERFFHVILIEGEMGVGKPAPEVFARAESAAPSELLFVGNSYAHDIRPALERGWRAAWVRRPSDVPPSADGTDHAPEDVPAGAPSPDLVINDLRQILSWLDAVSASCR
jgi:putative hydrolase of the HAD superfamily